MDTKETPEQLQMAFEADERLEARLNSGEFQILVEMNSPPSKQPFESAMALARGMAAHIVKQDDVAAIAVTDRLRTEASHDPVDVSRVLMDTAQKPVLMHLSGKGSTEERVRKTLAGARSHGICSILAVTGDRSDQHPVKPGSGRPLDRENGYLESVDILRLATRGDDFFYLGAVINPFKYNPADQYLQYYKAVRKLSSGADFIVTHAGWDMKKMQELQWYLTMRQISNAVIARVLLLSLEDIRGLETKVWPGVHVPREFTAMLQRESDISATQCLAAQLPRIGLQAAGFRLMGYSGVQIAGVKDQGTLEMVLARVRESLQTYTTYEEWLEAWQEYHGNMAFAPVTDPYYVFRNLLTAGNSAYDPERVEFTDRSFPAPPLLDRARGAILPLMLSRRTPGWLSTAYRAVFRGGDETPAGKLRHCFYLNHRHCPKHLVYGACGGSTPHGDCEFEHAPCFFQRVLGLAATTHKLDRLEEPVRND